MRFWTPNREIILHENRAAPFVCADGGIIRTGRTMARITLFARNFDESDVGDSVIVTARVSMPIQGWYWTLEHERARNPPIYELLDDRNGWLQ